MRNIFEATDEEKAQARAAYLELATKDKEGLDVAELVLEKIGLNGDMSYFHTATIVVYNAINNFKPKRQEAPEKPKEEPQPPTPVEPVAQPTPVTPQPAELPQPAQLPELPPLPQYQPQPQPQLPAPVAPNPVQSQILSGTILKKNRDEVEVIKSNPDGSLSVKYEDGFQMNLTPNEIHEWHVVLTPDQRSVNGGKPKEGTSKGWFKRKR